MTVRNLSPVTQQSYVYAVPSSAVFSAVRWIGWVSRKFAYQLHLAGLGWSWSHINQMSCALHFSFGVTRPKGWPQQPNMAVIVFVAVSITDRVLAKEFAT